MTAQWERIEQAHKLTRAIDALVECIALPAEVFQDAPRHDRVGLMDLHRKLVEELREVLDDIGDRLTVG